MIKELKTQPKIGHTYNRLTVVGLSHKDNLHRKHYVCRCSCGIVKTVQGSLVVSGNTKSCGCFAAESRKKNRLINNAGVINQILLQYKRHSRSRCLEFKIDRSVFEDLIRSPCRYCGEVAGNVKRTKNCKEGFAYNGIDRVDSNIGYTKENAVPCCGVCNRAKRDMSKDDFISLAFRITKHQSAMAAQWGHLQ